MRQLTKDTMKGSLTIGLLFSPVIVPAVIAAAPAWPFFAAMGALGAAWYGIGSIGAREQNRHSAAARAGKDMAR